GARAERAAAHHLADRRVVEVGEAGAVLGVGQEQVPQPEPLGLGADLLHHRRLGVRVAARLELLLVHALVRVDVLLHEALDLAEDRLALVGRLEVHGWLAPAGAGCGGGRRARTRRSRRRYGTTLTLTVPARRSAASAKPRSTSASGMVCVTSGASASRAADTISTASAKSAPCAGSSP